MLKMSSNLKISPNYLFFEIYYKVNTFNITRNRVKICKYNVISSHII